MTLTGKHRHRSVHTKMGAASLSSTIYDNDLRRRFTTTIHNNDSVSSSTIHNTDGKIPSSHGDILAKKKSFPRFSPYFDNEESLGMGWDAGLCCGCRVVVFLVEILMFPSTAEKCKRCVGGVLLDAVCKWCVRGGVVFHCIF